MDPEELKAALIERDNAIGGRLDTLLDRIEAIEARNSNSGITANRNTFHGEWNARFFDWMRKSDDESRKNELHEIQKRGVERKEITIGSNLGGGFAVPEEISRQVEKLELLFSPVRRICKVIQTSTSDYKELVSLRGAGAGWVGETGTRSATATPTLRERVPTNGELYAYPQASEHSLDDMFFNVQDWLAMELAEQFSVEEGQAVIDGNGTNRPTGMLDTTPTLGEDFGSPLRDADAYEYIVSDTDVDASPSAPGIRADSLIDLFYKVRSPYRMQGVWVMNSTTAGAIRKLKDTTGQYLWQPSLIIGQPDTLLGRPIEIWEQMPSIAAGNFPVAFGDFRRGYLLTNRIGLRITVDPYSQPGYVRFYVRRRVGGTPLVNDAIKFLRSVD
jgi:HK97 family phage major capsid protein